ncbi:MAG: hypothetical protein ABIO49_13580 [Dokdonella sp.]
MATFPTTRWSLIQANDRSSAEVAAAWGELVRDYRPAILAFFRRSLLARDADDLTQEFLLRSISDGWWSRADPQVGCFRHFLLVLLRRFLAQQRDAGHRRFEVFDTAVVEAALVEGTDAQTPERQFDLEFALCLVRIALTELRREYERDGRSDVFDALQPWLLEAPAHGELAVLGARLQAAPNTLAVQLKRLRTRFQKAVRAALAQLSVDAAHAEADLTELRAALAMGADA